MNGKFNKLFTRTCQQLENYFYVKIRLRQYMAQESRPASCLNKFWGRINTCWGSSMCPFNKFWGRINTCWGSSLCPFNKFRAGSTHVGAAVCVPLISSGAGSTHVGAAVCVPLISSGTGSTHVDLSHRFAWQLYHGKYLLNNTTLCANWSLHWGVLRS